MSWRFRKTFKVIPGVKLNLTARGLSATIGGAPFSLNVGPRGTYANIGIPGTGIWTRQRIDNLGSSLPAVVPIAEDGGRHGPESPVDYHPPEPAAPVFPSTAKEIRSASTELLTSESLEQLRNLLGDAYTEHEELTEEVSRATVEANAATGRYQRWNTGFLFKRLFKKAFALRKETAETAVAKLDEFVEQLRLTTVATEISIDPEQAEPYYRMRDAFASLSECQKIWNILAEQRVDHIAERSTADTNITRTLVPFSLQFCDLLEWDQKVPHLANQTGGDMFIYPGFLLYRASKQAFALIDFSDVTLRYVSTTFTETEAIPSDSSVIGHTWAKCNKDGTPDRRFKGNYQIPQVHYGSLLFGTREGLDVRYLCSNAERAAAFVGAWQIFKTSLSSKQISGKAPKAEGITVSTPIKIFLDAVGEATTIFNEFGTTCTQEFLAQVLEYDDNGNAISKQTISKTDVVTYLNKIRQVIEYDSRCEHNGSMLPRSLRTRFRRASTAFEKHVVAFANSLDTGTITTEMFVGLTNAIKTYGEARTAFLADAKTSFEKGSAASA